LDDNENKYVLNFEIVKNTEDNKWYVTRGRKVYSTATEPTDSSTTFTNEENESLVLEFDDYVMRFSNEWHIENEVVVK